MIRENDDLQALLLAAESEADAPARVSSRLQSRIFSKLIEMQQQQGPLRTLSASKASGAELCVFEAAVAAIPSADLQSRNPCAVCHARVLGERVERAPIYWPGCAYAKFCGH
jgi:hypothetical protein